jgi:hypothetical protein
VSHSLSHSHHGGEFLSARFASQRGATTVSQSPEVHNTASPSLPAHARPRLLRRQPQLSFQRPAPRRRHPATPAAHRLRSPLPDGESVLLPSRFSLFLSRSRSFLRYVRVIATLRANQIFTLFFSQRPCNLCWNACHTFVKCGGASVNGLFFSSCLPPLANFNLFLRSAQIYSMKKADSVCS